MRDLPSAVSSRSFILIGRRLQLCFPLQNAGTRGGGFSLGNVSCLLERNGQGRVGEWIVWSQSSQSESSTNRLVNPAGIAQGADESVVRFSVRRVGGYGGAKGRGSLSGRVSCKQAETTLEVGSGKRFGGVMVGGHGSF